jgi:hypothetical protein
VVSKHSLKWPTLADVIHFFVHFLCVTLPLRNLMVFTPGKIKTALVLQWCLRSNQMSRWTLRRTNITPSNPMIIAIVLLSSLLWLTTCYFRNASCYVSYEAVREKEFNFSRNISLEEPEYFS